MPCRDDVAMKRAHSSRISSRILCGDARLPASYARLLPAKSQASLLLTDPPYCLLERRDSLRGSMRRARKLDDEATVSRFRNIAAYSEFTQAWLTPALQWLSPSRGHLQCHTRSQSRRRSDH